MMKLLSMLLVAVFAVSLAGSAWAAEGAKKKEGGEKKGEAKKISLEDRFAKMDKNGDKKLDMDEFMGRATSEEIRRNGQKHGQGGHDRGNEGVLQGQGQGKETARRKEGSSKGTGERVR
jgi:hypothetical protein